MSTTWCAQQSMPELCVQVIHVSHAKALQHVTSVVLAQTDYRVHSEMGLLTLLRHRSQAPLSGACARHVVDVVPMPCRDNVHESGQDSSTQSLARVTCIFP